MERNKFIETVLDKIPLGVAVNKFEEGTATYINNEFVNIYGWPKDDLVDISNFFKKVYPDEKYRAEIQRRIMKDIDSGDSSRMHWEDIEITKQSGEKRIINAQNIPLFEQNLMISTVQDVTEKKQAEEALQKSEQRFRIIFENSLAVMLLIDPETRLIVAANKAAEKFYGWKRSKIETMCVDDINTLSPSEIAAEMEKARKSERIYFRFKHRLASGEVRDVEIYSGKVEIDGKDYLHSIIHDVSEQVEAEEALKESQNYNRTLFEQSPIGLALTSMDGKLIDVNPAFAAIVGRSIENVKILSYWDITPEKYAEQERKQLELLEKTGRYGPYEKEYIHKQGHLVPVRLQGLIFKKNNKRYIWSSVEDISERKKAEETLRKSEERFRVAQDFSPDGFTILHPLRNEKNEIIDFTWVYENQTIARINGTNPEEVKGKRLLDLFPTHKDTAIFEAYIDVANSGKPKILEEVYVGEVVSEPTWLRLVIVPMEEDIAVLAQNITERKKAEVALRESEEQYRTLFENMNSGFVLFEVVQNKQDMPVDLRIVAANQGFEATTGLNLKDAEGRNLTKVLPGIEQDEADWIGTYTKVALSGKAIQFEQGSELLGYYYAVSAYKAGPKQCAVTFVDITERKKAEEALSHSHDLMKYIIEHNQTSVAVLDTNLRYLYVSQRFLSEYRVKDKNIIGKQHYEVFPEIPEKWKKIHQKALQGIVSRADEDMFHRIDGTFDWTRWECRPWYEADGLIGGIILYLEVISEQKKKELEIIKLNQRLEILIGSVQQLAAATALDTVQDIVAKSARKLIGADGATLVFRENDNCFYVNEDAIQPLWKGKKFPMHSCISGWVMENKKSVVIEDVFGDERIPKDVYRPTFVKSLAMVPINISEPIGAIGNYWKETYTPTEIEMQLLQTLADAAARAIENIQLYTELEDRVKRRTQQLHAVNKELETFTYSVSHDLKAPLRGIDGYSKLLLDEYGDSLNEEASHFIKTIRSSTLQMNLLIEDLLSYSRLERSHFKQEKIALKSFTEKLVSNFGDEIKKGRFEVVINIPDVEIFTDSTGLTIILRNFIENAIKFTREKPNPKLEINFSENPENWIIAVKDNGVGFDMKYHDRIFEIFQRLHRAEDFPGTGIGLAMVAKAAQRMNGKTHAESVPGKGSVFFIEIQKNKSI
ncbi:PAS domain-containing sensor histidine kinase [Roseimarinus sediminis]|uniref:PAS domain-containing sensor histidine kinase n=1 Tax=Roseimarinus sediminis TaxID=1610899 RepID=UPI003D204396